jgi:PKD domain
MSGFIHNIMTYVGTTLQRVKMVCQCAQLIRDTGAPGAVAPCRIRFECVVYPRGGVVGCCKTLPGSGAMCPRCDNPTQCILPNGKIYTSVPSSTTDTAGYVLTVNASAAPTSGPAPLTVALTGSASGAPAGYSYSYSWEFGETTTGYGKTTSHSFKLRERRR